MVEHKLISTPLRHKVRKKAEGKCEKCGKRLFQSRRDELIQQYRDKVSREIAHIWRRDEDMHNISLDNLELVCDACYHELRTTKGGDEIEKESEVVLEAEILVGFSAAELEAINNAVRMGKARSMNEYIVEALCSTLRKDGVLGHKTGVSK